LHLLLLNDGQDLETMQYDQILRQLYRKNLISPVLTIGIKAGNRLQEYGITNRPDFKKRGAQARNYSRFIREELLPAIHAQTGLENFASYNIAGFSLGALSAFDIAWHQSDIFSKVGAFSGSFWWRSKDIGAGYTSNDRIAHKLIRDTRKKPDLKFWFMVGTKDEDTDRDQNGIVDSVDDTTDLILELYKKGYTRNKDINYVELIGGRHDVPTWGSMMPKFLLWAYRRYK
jgi:enterochelin esterase-like enzyme